MKRTKFQFKTTAILIAGLAIAWAPGGFAQQVLWGSPVGVDSVTSEGVTRPLDAGFTFQVGAFFEGEVPGWAATAGNTAEWANHWLAADSAVYNEAFRTFTGSFIVDPIFSGRQGYIWGFDNRSGDGEWILMTDPGWVFPAWGSGEAFPASWQTSGATTVIVGEVDNAPGAAFHLRTGSVSESSPPFMPSEQWLGMHFTHAELANPLIGSWGADADGDGLSNLVEMALGLKPRENRREGLPVSGLEVIGGKIFLSLVIRRAPNVAVSYDAEISSDLEHWETGAGIVTVVSDDPEELIVRDSLPLGPASRRFMRLKVSLEE